MARNPKAQRAVPPVTRAASAERGGAGANWTLAAAILGSSMIFIDGTAVNVALPVLQRDLQAPFASVVWVVEGFSLFLSALILIGGSLGDIFGRRLIFGIGIAAFTLASIGCAAAPNVELLVVARCAQGIGGALATPGSLALISAAFSGAARGRAIGTWSAFSVVISAVGPVFGGWLVQAASWRWIFLLNVPIAVAVVAILLLRVDESHDDGAPRQVDIWGAVLATIGLGALVYGLIRLQGGTLNAVGLLSSGFGVIILVAFVGVEARVRAPMIALSLFRVRPFAIANIYTLLLYAALGGSFYFVPFDLINVQGYTPAAAGAAMLPITVIMFSLSRFAGGLVARVGAGVLLAGGAALAVAAFIAFAAIGVGRPYWVSVFPAVLLFGFGAAAFVAPLTTLVMGAVESTHAGVASGINNAVSRTAGLLAIALLGIVLANVFSTTIERNLRGGSIAPATRATVEAQLPKIVGGAPASGIADPQQRTAVGVAIRAAYAHGFSVVMLVSAVFALLAAGLALDPALRVAPRPAVTANGARAVPPPGEG